VSSDSSASAASVGALSKMYRAPLVKDPSWISLLFSNLLNTW